MKTLMNLLLLFCLPLCLTGQSELFYDKEYTIAIYETVVCNIIDTGAVLRIEYYTEGDFISNRFFYYGDELNDYGKPVCDSMVEEYFCHECVDFLLNMAIKKRPYQWRKMDDSTYLSKSRFLWNSSDEIIVLLMHIKYKPEEEVCLIITYTKQIMTREERRETLKRLRKVRN
ncbi:MAG: hypothetical protein JKY03_05255 [Aureispira sp.]|nr:hypothetical protein [Aureispira sp.]